MLTGAYYYNSYYFDVAYLFFNYGLRLNEVYEINRWADYDEYNYILTTEKGSATRLILKQDCPYYFQVAISEQTEAFPMARSASFNRVIKKFSDYYEFFSEDKHISSHIFRHNKIKQLNDERMPIEDIQNFIGEKSEYNIYRYINSVIYGE
jgi:hypothetical protein